MPMKFRLKHSLNVYCNNLFHRIRAPLSSYFIIYIYVCVCVCESVRVRGIPISVRCSIWLAYFEGVSPRKSYFSLHLIFQPSLITYTHTFTHTHMVWISKQNRSMEGENITKLPPEIQRVIKGDGGTESHFQKWFLKSFGSTSLDAGNFVLLFPIICYAS